MPRADIVMQPIYQFTDDLGRGMQEDLQSRTIIEEPRPQQVVGGEGDMRARDLEEIADDVINAVVYTDLVLRRAKAGLAGELGITPGRSFTLGATLAGDRSPVHPGGEQ